MTNLHAKMAIMVHFKASCMPDYMQLTPHQEQSLRDFFQSRIYGSHETDVVNLLESATGRPTFTDPNDTGHPGNAQIGTATDNFISAYNSIDTGLNYSKGTTFTCVRYEWIDGEKVAIYNYGLTAEDSQGNPIPVITTAELQALGITQRIEAEYFVQVSYTIPSMVPA